MAFVFNYHIETGKIAVIKGDTMATVVPFAFTIKGSGGHGSRPDMANNPIDAFTAIYTGMQSLRLRECDPYNPITYSVGSLVAGTKGNIIPDTLSFSGTGRM